MHGKPTLDRPRAVTTVIAMLAAMIAIGIVSAVAFLFQKEGAPMERLAAAERACAAQAYVSEREACMRDWLAASRAAIVARQP